MYKLCIFGRVVCGYFFGGVLLSATITNSAFAANSTSSIEEGLQLIANFADRMCEKIPLRGTKQGYELTVRGKVELNGLMANLVDVGIEGAAAYRKSEYEGVLQKDLATVLATSTACKLDIFHALKDKILRQGPDDDDPVYVTMAEGLRSVEKSLKDHDAPPDISGVIKEVYVLGSLLKSVVRFGKDYKTYLTPTPAVGDRQFSATPSSVYEEQGQRLRTLKIESRLPGEPWKIEKDETFVWVKGDWKKLP